MNNELAAINFMNTVYHPASMVFDTFLVWHDVAEGLAVGVGFGAVGKTATATFENARYY